ncbi:bifunctional diguanylate cyclase/phosphodiesterase [Psychrobacillus soli]|uniref:bifunctional diguanylate cyclase/phosphodiesterase n=1 Tax=Psychrobacillus soli TaxID=1543965 RepID=UPI00163BA59D|nr:EAL domain-containing protein [Psychrobacillus soli]
MFRNGDLSNVIGLDVEYSIPIVILSFFLICIASYTALEMNNRTEYHTIFPQNVWFVLGAIALGFGIWSMHFVGMFAFTLPIAIRFDRFLTVISIVPALLASFLSFYIANRTTRSSWYKHIPGVITGIGTVITFYVVILAMKTEAYYTVNLGVLSLAIIATIIFSIVSNRIYRNVKRTRLTQLLASIVLSIAVGSMHYIGVGSIGFYIPDYYSPTSRTFQMVNMDLLVVNITIGMIILLGILILSTVIDKYIEYKAVNFDILTNLPNRRLFELKLKKPEFPQYLAIWHIHDLDHVNREHDYQFGDEVIQHIASILKTLVPPKTEIYRIEGHRFGFLVKSSVDVHLQQSMDSISDVLRQPLVVHGKEVLLQAVCAISKANNYEEVENIYTNALAVLNHRSILYNHDVIHYDSSIHTYTFEREIAEDITRAMQEEELFLLYQPKVNGKTNEITGFEALLRWNHRTHGFISPGVFIPILEEYNGMVEVTDWIVDAVCKQISEWQKEGMFLPKVAINIPGQYVTSSRLFTVLQNTISNYKTKPQQIELEITETSFMKNMEEAMKAVRKFRQAGFSVALDDFGTGVSSLSYLKQIPISTLKIDKSFIDEVPHSEKDSSIIQAIIGLGESLELAIIFEGVETKGQLEFLKTACRTPVIQGYYFAKPMKPNELIKWIQLFRSSNSEVENKSPQFT